MSHDASGATRAEMVAGLRTQGWGDPLMLAAMAQVPRERFVPADLAEVAYEARPLPIGYGQTISDPEIVAMMTAALRLRGGERVLEVGTGSGYAAAVLSRCAHEVVTIEYHQGLADAACQVLAELGYDNVEVRHGDGCKGAADRAPFDAISVTAMAHRQVPPALLDQLAPGGVLVCPVRDDADGELVRQRGEHTEALLPVRFVPLIEQP